MLNKLKVHVIKNANFRILAINGRHNPNRGAVVFVLRMKIIRIIHHIEQHTRYRVLL